VAGPRLLARLQNRDITGALERGAGLITRRRSIEEELSKPISIRLEGAAFKTLVRYCPICHGYEALDKKIAVLGSLHRALREATFLRTYSKSVTVLPYPASAAATRPPSSADITIILEYPVDFRETGSGIAVKLQTGEWKPFDVLYAALGCRVHSTYIYPAILYLTGL
jgi:hypothetical protein